MSSQIKINRLKDEILKQKQIKLNGLLSLCESEIEQLFLLNVINYFESTFGDLVERTNIEYTIPDPLKVGDKYFVNRKAQRNRQNCVVFPYSYKVEHVFFSMELIPQHEITLNGKNFRFDFLLDIQRKASETQLKICIECDGKDYHGNTVLQDDYDNHRDALCQSNGILVFRYTGSKIYGNSSFSSFKSIINQIVDLASK